MKEINTKAMFKALEEQKKAESNLAYFAAHQPLGKNFTAAQEAVDAATLAFDKEIEKLAEAISTAEGRATSRTIEPMKVLNVLKYIENTLGITKKAMDGISISADPNCQSFPSAYKYRPESTHFDAIFKGGSWRITNIYRDECKANFHIRVNHTDASRAAIVEKMSAF